jgi:hypothetical protein
LSSAKAYNENRLCWGAKGNEGQKRKEAVMKKCPYCAEEIQDEAIKCKHCGKDLKKNIGLYGWILIVFLAFCAFRIISSFNNPDTNQRVESTANPVNAVEEKIYKEGDTVSIGYTSYAVWESHWSTRLSDNQFLNEKPNAMFLFVELTVRNNDNKPRTIPPFKLIDENGAEYETSSNAWGVEGSIGILESLNPKVEKRGYIVFDIPTNHQYKLKVSGGYWSSEDTFIELSPKSSNGKALDSKQDRTITSQESSLKIIEATSLIQAYEESPLQSDLNFIRKHITVRGYVLKVVRQCVWLGDKDAIQIYKHPNSGLNFPIQVRPIVACCFERENQAAKVRVGEIVTIAGTCLGKPESTGEPRSIMITGCSIYEGN